MWTGWDHLGEVGVGRPVYKGDPSGFAAPYPWVTSCSGDIDITGHRRPQSYYRQVIFGITDQPYLVVQRPEHHHEPITPQAWTWSDGVPS